MTPRRASVIGRAGVVLYVAEAIFGNHLSREVLA
jgi:hypothetical protein